MNRKLLAALGVAVTSTAVLCMTALPASADTTDVTFALSGGALAVSAQPTTALGNKGSSGTTSVSGSLGDTVLTDNRGGTLGWSVGAATGAFTDGTTTASAVSYAPPATPTSTGIVVATGTTQALTAVPAQVMAGTLVVGNNTATWNPTLTVTLPASSTAGSYAGTITTSLL
ncbi:MAG TPA: hypothetical protein VFD59_12620 [Nocardioidaceae bacterium]|nr:hypothetical protein [Nocardioidaceae bacterium]